MRQYGAMFPRTALVTGGASGIGAAIVKLLEVEGAEVEVLDITGGFDVSDVRAWEAVGPVELACLNAGVTTGEADIDLLRLASELVIDAIVQPEDLREELVRRLALAAGKDRSFSERRHGIPPV